MLAPTASARRDGSERQGRAASDAGSSCGGSACAASLDASSAPTSANEASQARAFGETATRQVANDGNESPIFRALWAFWQAPLAWALMALSVGKPAGLASNMPAQWRLGPDGSRPDTAFALEARASAGAGNTTSRAIRRSARGSARDGRPSDV